MNADKNQKFFVIKQGSVIPEIEFSVSGEYSIAHSVDRRSSAFIGGFLLAFTLGAQAQPYPNKPIRLVVVSAPGGTTDLLARLFTQKLGEQLGQQVVVDNRPGGGTVIASEIVAHAPADGYTILFTHTSFSVLPSLHAKLPYDPFKDFAPISLAALTHSILVVNPALPAKSVKELIDLARAHPGKLNFGAGSTGASAHLGGELFKMMAHVDIVHVPYKGTAAQLTALVAGETQMSFATMPSALPLVKAGRVRALAIGSPERTPTLPDLPTVSESGLPGFDVSAWNGFMAPAHTPRAVIARLNAEIAKTVHIPELKERAANQGSDLVSDSPQEFTAFIKTQIAKWASVVKASGMRPD